MEECKTANSKVKKTNERNEIYVYEGIANNYLLEFSQFHTYSKTRYKSDKLVHEMTASRIGIVSLESQNWEPAKATRATAAA